MNTDFFGNTPLEWAGASVIALAVFIALYGIKGAWPQKVTSPDMQNLV